jgi:hypothetical protein
VSAGWIEVSVASLRRERPGLLRLRAHRTWKTSALLKVVEGRAQGECFERSLKGSERKKAQEG